MMQNEKAPLSRKALALIWTGGILCLIGIRTTGIGQFSSPNSAYAGIGGVAFVLGMILVAAGILTGDT